MSFVGDFLGAVIDVVTAIVDIVVQIVEIIIEFIMMLLGFEETTQVIEYFEVHNVPFFDDVDQYNPLRNVLMRSVIEESDIAGNLIYATAFRALKGNIRKFLQYIEQGNYMEGFPVIDSYITYPDYDEITDVLTYLEGVPCTIENAYTRALTQVDWVEYWLQENKSYSFETKMLPAEIRIASTSPASTSSSAVPGGTSPNLTVAVTDEVATSDSFTVSIDRYIDIATIVYNSGTDDYSVDVYDSLGNYETLPYNIPSRPTELHYIVTYYIDSVPSVTYLFVYKAGEGTYPTLDNPQNEININADELQAIPAIPLRLSNVDYTTRPQTEIDQIDELSALVGLDAPAILDAIKNDPAAPAAGDLDHIYINFGIKMWDTSQTGMTYLFNMCENLFPAQGVTQGTYNEAPAGDTKPQNNIIITTNDYKYLFQWSYITFEFTTLAAIDADTGSPENGYYYSDMSKFDDEGVLRYPYYVSSGKGTYNVGYKADTLAEVQDFLDGNGVVNPGTTTGEATDWMQVTDRMVYNNPSPVLLDADNSVSDLVYLTPDLVYENNGSGTLRHVNAASEATTVGQSITYYKAIPSGLAAYTMVAPIGSLKVIDGDSSAFRMVKFNLGHKTDLMVPFIYNFIADLSNSDVTRLFLAGSHASIYVAHYEVIVQRSGFGFLKMIVLIILIIVVFVVVGWMLGPGSFSALFAAELTAVVDGIAVPISIVGDTITVISTGAILPAGTVITSTAAFTGIISIGTIGAMQVAWVPTFLSWAGTFIVNQIISYAVGAIAKKSPALAAVFAIAAVAIAGSVSYTTAGGIVVTLPGFVDITKMFASFMQHMTTITDIYLKERYTGLEAAYDQMEKGYNAAIDQINEDKDALAELKESLFAKPDEAVLAGLIHSTLRVQSVNTQYASVMLDAYNEIHDAQFIQFEQSEIIDYGYNTEIA